MKIGLSVLIVLGIHVTSFSMEDQLPLNDENRLFTLNSIFANRKFPQFSCILDLEAKLSTSKSLKSIKKYFPDYSLSEAVLKIFSAKNTKEISEIKLYSFNCNYMDGEFYLCKSKITPGKKSIIDFSELTFPKTKIDIISQLSKKEIQNKNNLWQIKRGTPIREFPLESPSITDSTDSYTIFDTRDLTTSPTEGLDFKKHSIAYDTNGAPDLIKITRNDDREISVLSTLWKSQSIYFTLPENFLELSFTLDPFDLKKTTLQIKDPTCHFKVITKERQKILYKLSGQIDSNWYGVQAFEMILKIISTKEPLKWVFKIQQNNSLRHLMFLAEGVNKGSQELDKEDMYTQAYKFEEGLGCEQDPKEAFIWYKKSADLGHGPALLKVAKMFQTGVSANNDIIVAQDFRKSIYYYKMAADKGNAEAFYQMALMYCEGQGLKKDTQAYIENLERAAALNHGSAIDALANLYSNGEGVKKDIVKAKELWDKAEKLDNPLATYSLGVLYEEGKDIPQNLKIASEYYLKAGKLGCSAAYHKLALIYQNGQSQQDKGYTIQKNINTAIKFYLQGIKLGDPDSMFNLAVLYGEGKEIPYNLQLAEMFFKNAIERYKKLGDFGDTLATLKLAQMLQSGVTIGDVTIINKNFYGAIQYFQIAASKGSAEAFYQLALMSYEGLGLKKDIKACIENLEKAAELNHSNAIIALADLYSMGEGVKKNILKAKTLWEKAEKLNNPIATYSLGVLYDEGNVISQDLKMASYYYFKAGNLGCSQAYHNLALMYQEGQSQRDGCYTIQQDFKRAVDFYERAIVLENPDSMVNLGLLYEEGNGVLKDPKMAIQLFEDAANLGHPLGLFSLGYTYLVGEHVQKNEKLAIDYYNKAISLGCKEAMHNLASIYLSNGKYKEAFKLYSEASETGLIFSKFPLAKLYFEGCGTKKDVHKAKELLEQVRFYINQNGNPKAPFIIRKLFDPAQSGSERFISLEFDRFVNKYYSEIIKFMKIDTLIEQCLTYNDNMNYGFTKNDPHLTYTSPNTTDK